MAKNFNELDVVCHAGKTATKTLVASAEFYIQKKEDELPFRESNLSRLDISLITKTSGATDVLIFNIPAREINELKLKTDIAVAKLMESTPTSISATSVNGGADGFSTGPAFTIKLMINAFKGRTAAEVLISNPGNKAELIKGKAWLESNLAKYPANQAQLDAINDALNLLEIGELTTHQPESAPVMNNNIITLYKREYKYKAKKDDKGNNLVYSVTISCDPAKNMPFEVSVMNCFAPVITTGSGQTIVKTTEAINSKRANISLSDSEWIGLIYQAYDLYQNFKNINAAAAFKRATENSYSPV